eukprot:PITA_36107
MLDRPKKQNTVADFLSRIQNIKDDTPVEDMFPDEYLFAVTTQTPSFVDIANYLVTGSDLMIRRCFREDEMLEILKACHDEPCGGHFADKRTTYKILSLGYYWPSIFKDAKEYVRRCDSCQRVGKPSPSNEMALQIQGSQFTSRMVKDLVENYKIKHRKSTPYHPQANGQVESTNKVIEGILTKTLHLHRRDWAERLPEALWAYRTTWRNTMGHTPYELVYGKQALFPIEFQIKTFKTTVQSGLDLLEAPKHRLEQLNELDEIKQDAVQRTSIVQQQREKWNNKYIKEKKFQAGDWALLFDSKFKDFQGKFQTHWLGPYETEKVFNNGAVRIRTIDEEKVPLLVNGHWLKIYQTPVSREEFIRIF